MMTFVTTIITAYTTATIFILYKPIYRTYNIKILDSKIHKDAAVCGTSRILFVTKIANTVFSLHLLVIMLSASMIVFSGVL